MKEYRCTLQTICTAFSENEVPSDYIDALACSPFYRLFLGLYKLKCRRLPKHENLICDILDKYEPIEEAFVIGGVPMRVTANDVRLILGVEGGSTKVPSFKKSELKASPWFKKKFPGTTPGTLLMSELKKVIANCVKIRKKSNRKTFVRCINMLAMSTIFYPSSSGRITAWHAMISDNLAMLKDYNWAQHIADSLMNSADGSVEGCWIMLLPWFCEHVKGSRMEPVDQNAIPRLFKWLYSESPTNFKAEVLDRVLPEMVNITSELRMTKDEILDIGCDVEDVALTSRRLDGVEDHQPIAEEHIEAVQRIRVSNLDNVVPEFGQISEQNLELLSLASENKRLSEEVERLNEVVKKSDEMNVFGAINEGNLVVGTSTGNTLGQSNTGFKWGLKESVLCIDNGRDKLNKFVGVSSDDTSTMEAFFNKKKIDPNLSLSEIVELNERLTKEQKIAVESIGFGSILNLRCNTIIPSLCKWIVKNFDASSMSLVIHGKKLEIDSDDVEQILGIPNRGLRVPIDGPDDELIEELCHTFSETESIQLNILGNELVKCETHGDEFKRMYCVYILGYLLCPSIEYGVKKGLLHAIKDVTKINSYNWAQFVLDSVANGIDHSSGCLFLLMMQIFFLEHVNTCENLPREHNMSPSICYWSTRKMWTKLGKFKSGGGYKSPSACFVLDKRVVHEAEKDEELECFDTQTRLSKIEAHISELKNGRQDVEKNFCEMKDLLHLILDSQRAKTSNGDKETGDQCGPTVGITGIGGKRVLDDEQNVSNQSSIGSSKKLRIDGEFTDIPSMERYIQQQSEKELILRNEVKKLESEMYELRERNREEMEKRDEVIVRLESELCGKEHLVQSYRESFEEMYKDLAEEPMFKDAAGTSYNTSTNAKSDTRCVKQEKEC